MKDLKILWAYASVTALWFGSQLGLVDASHVEAKDKQPSDQKLQTNENKLVYLNKANTIQNSLEEILAHDNFEQYAHYSHRSHSSHRSHYSHYSGAGSQNNNSSQNNSGYNNQPVTPVDSMDIRAIQKKLNELGYDCGVVDGIKGSKTRESIRNFQMDYNQAVDGIVGTETKKKLEAVDLISIQKKLKQLGYECNIDGIRDEKTIQAIKDFQLAEGLDSYGTINCVTKEAIEKK